MRRRAISLPIRSFPPAATATTSSDGPCFRRRRRPAVRELRQLGPTRIAQIIVKELRLVAHSRHALREPVVDVLLDKLGALELLAGERTEPLVLGQLLAVGHHELLQLVGLRLEAELLGLFFSQLDQPGAEDGLQFFFRVGHVLDDGVLWAGLGVGVGGSLWMTMTASHMEEAAAVGHLVLVGILGEVVVVEAVDQPQVEEQKVQHSAQPLVLNQGARALLQRSHHV